MPAADILVAFSAYVDRIASPGGRGKSRGWKGNISLLLCLRDFPPFSPGLEDGERPPPPAAARRF